MSMIVFMGTYMWVCACVDMHASACMCIYHCCVTGSVCVYTYECVCVCVCVCMCVCVCVCVCVIHRNS